MGNFQLIEGLGWPAVVNQYYAQQVQVFGPDIACEIGGVRAMMSMLPPQSLVVDAGANVGTLAIAAAVALQGSGGAVHAYEVQRLLYYAMCGTIALNSIINLHPHHQGLGDKCCWLNNPIPDYGVDQDVGYFSLNEGYDHGEPVEIVTVDSLDLPRLDFLKIDVERMECAVLKGARHTIERYQPWCWVEKLFLGAEAIKQCFAGLDYRFYGSPENPNMLCAPRARADSFTLELPAI